MWFLLSLLTNVTCVPGGTVRIAGLTPVAVIVMVVPPGVGVGVGVGDGDVLEPPPHAIITTAIAAAASNPQVVFVRIRRTSA